MTLLTLRAAFEKAQIDAPGITEQQFLEQTRVHLESGRLKGAAFDCVTEQPFERGNEGYMRLVPRTPDGFTRKVIPAFEWENLKLYFGDENDGSAISWGHERSPKWTRDDGRGGEMWGDGYFDGAPVYSELLLIADGGFDGLWEAAQKDDGEQTAAPMADDDLRDWIRAKEKELGRRPRIRTWEECPELKQRGVTKARFEAAWHAVYPNVEKGRPPKG